MIKITFLGTGTSQGIPVIGSDHPVSFSNDPKDKRLRSSINIQYNNFFINIDCGPDFRQQMLKLNCSKMDAILFTHEHADHTSGIDDVRPFYFKQGKIPIYLHKRVLTSFKDRYAYIFDSKKRYPGAPEFEINLIDKDSNFKIKDLQITPIESLHLNLPVLGFKIKDFAYLTDVKSIDETELIKLKNLKVLVLNALRFESHPSHLNVDEALSIIDKIKPKQTFFTHISHNMGFHQEVCNKLPSNVTLAYDGLEINLD